MRRQFSRVVATFVAAALVGGAALVVKAAADDKAAAEQPKPAAPAAEKKAAKADKAAKKAKAVRLVKPWSGMTSLSEEQKVQINDIHKKALAEIKEVRQRELDAILAVLSEQQKAEYQDLINTDTVEKKMKKSGADAAGEAKTESNEKSGG